jgi:hypothetical protein
MLCGRFISYKNYDEGDRVVASLCEARALSGVALCRDPQIPFPFAAVLGTCASNEHAADERES